MSVRDEIIKKLQSGHTDADIAREERMSLWAVKQIRTDWEPHARVQGIRDERVDTYKAGLQLSLEICLSQVDRGQSAMDAFNQCADVIRQEIKKL